jgi:hypothetical protein
VDAERLDRIAQVLSGIDGVPALEGLLDAAVDLLALRGACVAVTGAGEHQGTVAVVGPGIAAVDDLQFSLGEGPCVSVAASPGPVLEPDLAAAGGHWPVFAPAAMERGVGAVFAFPLRVGTVHLGVLTLFRSEPGLLDGPALADAITFSHVATHLMLALQADLPPGSMPDHLADVVDHRARVHQATGMVAAQLGTDVAAALGILRAFAWSRDRSLADVAVEVIDRGLRFDEDGGPVS